MDLSYAASLPLICALSFSGLLNEILRYCKEADLCCASQMGKKQQVITGKPLDGAPSLSKIAVHRQLHAGDGKRFSQTSTITNFIPRYTIRFSIAMCKVHCDDI